MYAQYIKTHVCYITLLLYYVAKPATYARICAIHSELVKTETFATL